MRLFKNGNNGPPAPESNPAAAPLAAPAPSVPDPTAAVARYESALKDMSERLSSLASSLENNAGDRQLVEQKLDLMEDRMRKLAALTEMASARYNPFVGEEPGEPPRMGGDESPLPAVGASASLPMPLAAPPPAAVGAPPAAASFAPARDDPRYFPPDADEKRAHLERIAHTVDNARTILTWADNLLAASGSREGLDDLLQYYESIGWISPDVRQELLAYAAGLPGAAWEAERPPTDWRGGMDVHERTLLYIEKLRNYGR